jgi:hypothetical protein
MGGNDDYFDLIEWIEEEFDCSGLCTEVDYYLFSDINRGDPDDDCMSALKDWASEMLLLFGIITVIFGTWLIVAMVVSYCLCCNTRTENKPSGKATSDVGTDRHDASPAANEPTKQ